MSETKPQIKNISPPLKNKKSRIQFLVINEKLLSLNIANIDHWFAKHWKNIF